MKISLYIEQIVVHGVKVQERAFRTALEQELAHLLKTRGVPEQLHAHQGASLFQPRPLPYNASRNDHALGRSVGAVVYESLARGSS